MISRVERLRELASPRTVHVTVSDVVPDAERCVSHYAMTLHGKAHEAVNDTMNMLRDVGDKVRALPCTCEATVRRYGEEVFIRCPKHDCGHEILEIMR